MSYAGSQIAIDPELIEAMTAAILALLAMVPDEQQEAALQVRQRLTDKIRENT